MLECVISNTQEIEPVVHDWGTVKWVANDDVAPGCEQSLGLVHVPPARPTPEHWHTAAD